MGRGRTKLAEGTTSNEYLKSNFLLPVCLQTEIYSRSGIYYLKVWTTLEVDYILTRGAMLKPVQVAVLLSSSIKTFLIQWVHFGAGNKKAM
jgi:hypothetical protein